MSSVAVSSVAVWRSVPDIEDFHSIRGHTIDDDIRPQCHKLAGARLQAGTATFGEIFKPVAGGGSSVVVPHDNSQRRTSS